MSTAEVIAILVGAIFGFILPIWASIALTGLEIILITCILGSAATDTGFRWIFWFLVVYEIGIATIVMWVTVAVVSGARWLLSTIRDRP